VRFSPGCRCCNCNRTILVRGCNNVNLAGQVVTLKQGGVTIASCTTDVTGQCVVSIPAGTYDVSIPAGGGYAAYSGSLTHACPAGGTTTIDRAVDSGHICVSGCGACPAPPTSIAITWSYPPGYTGHMYNDDTVTWDGAVLAWFGTAVDSTEFPGNSFVYMFQCISGGLGYTLRRCAPITHSTTGFSGSFNTATPATCSPFNISNVGFQNFATGGITVHWSALG